jgi:hypoxanthine-DNA glycosylase
MSPSHSFPPLLPDHPRLLLLGSMPGQASLRAGQYYAHPRNAFWPIMGTLLGFAADAPYPERVAALTGAGVAVWDVLQSCVRPGSLDADIERDSEWPNPIPALLAARPGIAVIACNGSAAEACFRRHFLRPPPQPARRSPIQDPALATSWPPLLRLPSTSPAHAALSLEAKCAAWRSALAPWLSR